MTLEPHIEPIVSIARHIGSMRILCFPRVWKVVRASKLTGVLKCSDRQAHKRALSDGGRNLSQGDARLSEKGNWSVWREYGEVAVKEISHGICGNA